MGSLFRSVCGLGSAVLGDRNNGAAMVKVRLGGHWVEYYDAIDSLPVERYHRYQKALLVDSGIGADIASFDQRIERARRFLMKGDTEQAQRELSNLRQCVYMIQQELSPKHLAFAALVHSIDGKRCEDFSEDGLRGIVATLSGAEVKELASVLDSVKKKIDGELSLYFPSLFNQSDIKEYYDLMKRRTLAVLNNIVNGVEVPDGSDEVEKLTTVLVTYASARAFDGANGVEVQYDKNFENLCLALSSQLNISPKRCSVLEFYNAFDYLQQKMKRELRERAKK